MRQDGGGGGAQSLLWILQKANSFQKSSRERINFKVKEEAACSLLQMDGLWFKSILPVSAQWPFVSMPCPHTVVGGV